MVLVGADQDDRAGCRVDAEQADEAVQAGGGAGAREDDGAAFGMGETRDGGAGVGAHPGHDAAAMGGLGVAVGVIRKHLAHHEVLDLEERAAGGDVVGVDHGVLAEGAGDGRALADQAFAQVRDDVGAVEGRAEGGEGHGVAPVGFPEEYARET